MQPSDDTLLADLNGHELVQYLVDNCGLHEVLRSIESHCRYVRNLHSCPVVKGKWDTAANVVGYAAINPTVQYLSEGAPCDMGDE